MAHSRWVTKVERSVVRFVFMAALRATTDPPSTLQFLANDRGARHHRLHLPKRDIARQIFQPAVRRDNDALSSDMRQRTTDARRNLLRYLDRHVCEVEDAEQDGLARQLFEHGAVELRLRGLDRNLLNR